MLFDTINCKYFQLNTFHRVFYNRCPQKTLVLQWISLLHGNVATTIEITSASARTIIYTIEYKMR